MAIDYDIIIVGAGLAGTCSALHLGGRERILLVDSDDPPAGASSVAAGLVNPFMARKAKAAWRHARALEDLAETMRMAGASNQFRQSGVLRPAGDARQAVYFRRTAAAHLSCSWLSEGECAERFPEIVATAGALFVRTGGAVDIPAFIGDAIQHLRATGVTVRLGATLTDFRENEDVTEVVLEDGTERQHVSCRVLILTCGAGFRSMPSLLGLGLHAVKGQTIEVRPRISLAHLPHVAGTGYAVIGQHSVTVGSSFEHEFRDSLPDPDAGKRLIKRASAMLPALVDAEIMARSAGIRVTVAGRRLPVVGPLPGHHRVWTFTGLGSKGLLMAPLIAARLSGYLADPATIPAEIRAPW